VIAQQSDLLVLPGKTLRIFSGTALMMVNRSQRIGRREPHGQSIDEVQR
jgi:hypothetical protein